MGAGVLGQRSKLGRMSAGQLSRDEARLIALAGQRFDQPRPKRVSAAALARSIRQMAVLQLDFVNVLLPAHYLMLFSRLGAYRRELLDELIYQRHEFIESWAREAAVIPMETWPLLEYRRAVHETSRPSLKPFLINNRAYVKGVLQRVERSGPLLTADVPDPKGKSGRLANSTYPAAALEHLFGRGQIAVASRAPNFARAYALVERIVPATHRKRRVSTEDAHRELLRQAAVGLGVASAADLADYWRLPVRDARPRLLELVAQGELRQVAIEGAKGVYFQHAKARAPTRVDACCLLAPWDPLIDRRERTTLLFDFEYRNEIFVKAAKRKWGYYVLPFLLGDRLVARVDLKADRAGGRLLVLSAYLEKGAKSAPVARALAGELHALADWISLESISVERKGNLARALASVV